MIEGLTWTCHVCGRERPDDRISVYRRALDWISPGSTENVRYCNDSAACRAGAEHVHFVTRPDERA